MLLAVAGVVVVLFFGGRRGDRIALEVRHVDADMARPLTRGGTEPGPRVYAGIPTRPGQAKNLSAFQAVLGTIQLQTHPVQGLVVAVAGGHLDDRLRSMLDNGGGGGVSAVTIIEEPSLPAIAGPSRNLVLDHVFPGLRGPNRRTTGPELQTWVAFGDDDDPWHPRRVEATLAAVAAEERLSPTDDPIVAVMATYQFQSLEFCKWTSETLPRLQDIIPPKPGVDRSIGGAGNFQVKPLSVPETIPRRDPSNPPLRHHGNILLRGHPCWANVTFPDLKRGQDSAFLESVYYACGPRSIRYLDVPLVCYKCDAMAVYNVLQAGGSSEVCSGKWRWKRR